MVTVKFIPTTEDIDGPGTDGYTMYPNRGAFEAHYWFSTTSTIFGVMGAGVGSLLGGTKGAIVGSWFGIWLGNRTPPA